MLSKLIVNDVITYCSCYNDGDSDVDAPCAFASECVYKAECDEIRYTYGCKPCDIEQNIEGGHTENATKDY